MNRRIQGFVTISGITAEDGRSVSVEDAVRYGWIVLPPGRQPAGWGLERHEVPLGANLFLDQGRQCVAYAMGGRSPVTDYVIGKFGVGTGLTAARVTDVALEAEVHSGVLSTVDYISPFVTRFSFVLGLNDANGHMLSEMGLYTDNDTLVARKVRAVSINKVSTFSPTLSWRVRW